MSRVLIVEDDKTLCEALVDTLKLANFEVVAKRSSKEALASLHHFKPDMVVSDVRMDEMDGHQLLKSIHELEPGLPVMLITAYGTVEEAVDALHYGAVDYMLKPFKPQKLLEKINRYIAKNWAEGDTPIAKDPKSQALLALALKVANSDATVLVSGESGTGKEVLARFIHDHSARADKPYVAINCAAIPEQMLEATLFGYEKGAFTGAYKSMPGKFEQAQSGTILLDEISEMGLPLQAKLLRVLQEKEVERIGSHKTIELDVRLIATTNRDMKKEIRQGRFREDLYYRLNVFPLHWIPLRERRKDIIPVAEYLIRRHHQTDKGTMPALSKEAKKQLYAYDWPGNAREMENVIQRALILHSGEEITVSDLQLYPHDLGPESIEMGKNENTSKKQSLDKQIEQYEFEVIKSTLIEFKGDKQQAAKHLAISERSLSYKLTKLRKLGYLIEDENGA